MNENTLPSGYQYLTDVQIIQCLTLAKKGDTICLIATEVGTTKLTVGRVLKDYNYETFTQYKQHPGRTHKTSATDDRLLIRIAKQNYSPSFHDITNISGLSISEDYGTSL